MQETKSRWIAALKAERERRIARRARIEAKGLQAIELELCRESLVHWMRNWVWTFDPRELEMPMRPFLMFPRQEEAARWIEEAVEKQDGRRILDKSRDTGVSVLIAAFGVHGLFFREGFSAGYTSHKEKWVDAIGDPDSLFEKMRIVIRELPPWMLPENWRMATMAPKFRIINPATNSSLTGEVGEAIGRGGRKTVYFVDEAAQFGDGATLSASLAGTTEARIDVSTPGDDGCTFNLDRLSGNFPTFTISWRDDPRRSEEWAAWKKSTLASSPGVWEREFDLSYATGSEQVTIPSEWVRAAIDFPIPAADDDEAVEVAGLDVAVSTDAKANESVLAIRRSRRILPLIAWKEPSEGTYDRLVQEVSHRPKWRVVSLNIDADGCAEGVLVLLRKGGLVSGGEAVAVNMVRGASKAPSWERWADGKSSEEKFHNFRACLWWRAREAFRKTYEVVAHGASHHWSACVSIPNDPILIAQLSQPKYFRREGRILIESKDDMRRRGIASPDRADAAIYCLDEPKAGLFGENRRTRTQEVLQELPVGVFAAERADRWDLSRELR